jgi:hypothetical protein
MIIHELPGWYETVPYKVLSIEGASTNEHTWSGSVAKKSERGLRQRDATIARTAIVGHSSLLKSVSYVTIVYNVLFIAISY